MTDLAALQLAAGEINRANAAIKRVRSVHCTGELKLGLKMFFDVAVLDAHRR